MLNVKALRTEMRRRQVRAEDLADYIGEYVGTLRKHIREDKLTVKEIRCIQAVLQFKDPASVFFYGEMST